MYIDGLINASYIEIGKLSYKFKMLSYNILSIYIGRNHMSDSLVEYFYFFNQKNVSSEMEEREKE